MSQVVAAASGAIRGGDVVLTYRRNEADAQAFAAEIEALGRKAVALQLDTGKVASLPAFAGTLPTALRSTYDIFFHLKPS